MEESGLGERLPRLDVPDGGRAPVAKELEDLETALGQQEERCGRVALQEQRPLGRQQHGPRDGRDFGQLFVVELGEQLRGAQVEQGLVPGRSWPEVYRRVVSPPDTRSRPSAPPTASVGSARHHDDGGGALERALVLADAAADAALGDDLGARQIVLRAVGARDEAPAAEHDRLVRDGAHLLTDDAGRVRGPGQAAVPVDDGDAEHLLALLARGRAWGWRPRGTRGRRRCTSSRSSPGGRRARASTAPPARPRPATAAGRRSGRPSCTRCSAGSARGRRPRPGRPAGG